MTVSINETNNHKMSTLLESNVDALQLLKYPTRVVQQKEVSALMNHNTLIQRIQATKTDVDFDQITYETNEIQHEFTKELLLCRCEYYRNIEKKYSNPKQEGKRGGPILG